MEQEEDVIIRLQALRDRRAELGATPQDADAKALHTAFVNLHGELILLFHYSMVNYAGVMKILKKHDKIMGSQQDRKKEYLHTLLQQPFTSTESISRLVKEAEEEIRNLSPSSATGVNNAINKTAAAPGSKAVGTTKTGKDEAVAAVDEPLLVKRTRAALEMLEQLQQTAHTPSTLLPAGSLATEKAEKRPKIEQLQS